MSGAMKRLSGNVSTEMYAPSFVLSECLASCVNTFPVSS